MSFYTREIADIAFGKSKPLAKLDPAEANEWFQQKK